MADRPPRWLFVCSGNLCRSAMAERIAALEAERRGIALELRSAGTLGLTDEPADPKAIAACMELGIDLGDHRSRGLTAEDLAWADRVLVMTPDHASAALALHPDAAERIVSVANLIGQTEIADPHGSWFMGPYRRCRDELRRIVDLLLSGPAARAIAGDAVAPRARPG